MGNVNGCTRSCGLGSGDKAKKLPVDMYSGLDGPTAEDVNKYGPLQLLGFFLALGLVGGTCFYSVKTSGYIDNSDYNWVDTARAVYARFTGCVLFFLYSTAAIFFHTRFVDFTALAGPTEPPDGSSERPPAIEIWAETPTPARGACVSTGGWGVAYGMTMFCMTFFEPGCQRAQCICCIIMLLWWQVPWYVGMYNNIDKDDDIKLPWTNFFKKETLAEIINAIIAAVFVFCQGSHKEWQAPDEVTVNDNIRTWAIRIMCSLMFLWYTFVCLYKHTAAVGELAKEFVTDEDPDAVWLKTPTAAKFSALEGVGWGTQFFSLMVAMSFLAPGCEKGLCKCFAMVMIWWNIVWYIGMLGRVDFNDSNKTPWISYFKQETIMEIVLFSGFGYLGFIAQ